MKHLTVLLPRIIGTICKDLWYILSGYPFPDAGSSDARMPLNGAVEEFQLLEAISCRFWALSHPYLQYALEKHKTIYIEHDCSSI